MMSFLFRGAALTLGLGLSACDQPPDLVAEPRVAEADRVIDTIELPDGTHLTFIDQGDGVGVLELARQDGPSLVQSMQDYNATPLELWLAVSESEPPIELEEDHVNQIEAGAIENEEPRIMAWPETQSNPSEWGGSSCNWAYWIFAFLAWSVDGDARTQWNLSSSHQVTSYDRNRIWMAACNPEGTGSLGVLVEFRATGNWTQLFYRTVSPTYRLRYYSSTLGQRDYRFSTYGNASYRKSLAWYSLDFV